MIQERASIRIRLFLASMLIESRVVTDDGSRRLMSGVGLVGVIVGGILYGMSLRKSSTVGLDAKP
jgi:hypothetical protein